MYCSRDPTGYSFAVTGLLIEQFFRSGVFRGDLVEAMADKVHHSVAVARKSLPPRNKAGGEGNDGEEEEEKEEPQQAEDRQAPRRRGRQAEATSKPATGDAGEKEGADDLDSVVTRGLLPYLDISSVFRVMVSLRWSQHEKTE